MRLSGTEARVFDDSVLRPIYPDERINENSPPRRQRRANSRPSVTSTHNAILFLWTCTFGPW